MRSQTNHKIVKEANNDKKIPLQPFIKRMLWSFILKRKETTQLPN